VDIERLDMANKIDPKRNVSSKGLFRFSREGNVSGDRASKSTYDLTYSKDTESNTEEVVHRDDHRTVYQSQLKRSGLTGLDKYIRKDKDYDKLTHLPTQNSESGIIIEAIDTMKERGSMLRYSARDGRGAMQDKTSDDRLIYYKRGSDSTGLDPSIFEIPEAIEVEGYVMEVQYDGGSSKAFLLVYVEEEGKLYKIYDKTGHRPYFLVDLDPEKVREVIGKSQDIIDVYRVEKFDLLLNRKVMLTKIVVRDPLAVRKLRDRFPKTWEANIKYHHNYIYDIQLIPGLKYRVRGGRFDPIFNIELDKVSSDINKIFADEPEHVREIATRWYPLFEAPPPRIKRLSIDIEVYTPNKGRIPNPGSAEFPIVSIATCNNDGECSVFILKRGDEKALERLREVVNSKTNVHVFESERELIKRFFQEISGYPVIVSFNGDNFDLPYLYTRSRKLGFSREEIPIVIKETHATFKHAIHIDLYRFFKNRAIQNYAFEGRYKEYTLDAIAQALLGKGKLANEEGVGSMSLYDLATYNLRDAQLTIELTTFSGELLWKLMILLMRISKLGIEDVTRTQVSTWIKNLFYWEHRSKGYLIPSESDLGSLKSRKATEAIIKGKKYAGAIVIDPPQGVFFDVVVADYASLYPSIIKRWNLSYETVDPPEGECAS